MGKDQCLKLDNICATLNDNSFIELGFTEYKHAFIIDNIEINRCDDGSYRFYYTPYDYTQIKYLHKLKILIYELIGKEL